MDRSNPYEAAFEGYLKAQGLCYVAVDETRRACLGGHTPVKNLDFIVLGQNGAKLLIDVKGRQFPGGPDDKPRYVWENWSTQEDIDGLESWVQLFGQDYLALFVFMYLIRPTIVLPAETPAVWQFRDASYLLRAITLADYHRHMKVRSQKWGTVALPGAAFKELVRPFRYYSHELPSAREEGAEYGSDQDRHFAAIAANALAAFAAVGAAPRRRRR
jgi:hypothetical protein